eukprot:g13486.t1
MASSLPHDSKKCAAPLRLIGLSAFPLLALVPCRAWLSNIGARALLPRPVRRGSHVVVAALPEDADGDGSTDWDKALQRATERLKKKELQEGVLTAVPLFDRSDDWTVERVDLKDEVPAAGTVLLADPRTFLESKTMPAAAARTGWMPSFESPQVVLITEHRSEGIEGVLLGSWSGKLMGDMGLEHFMTRPLYIGGANPGRGLSMLHSYPEMPGASQLTEDGLAVRTYHPDVPGTGDEDRFRSIREALEELGTEAGRARWSTSSYSSGRAQRSYNDFSYSGSSDYSYGASYSYSSDYSSYREDPFETAQRARRADARWNDADRESRRQKKKEEANKKKAQGAQAQELERFQKGDKVVFCNLKSNADDNGKFGVIVGFDETKQRYQVSVGWTSEPKKFIPRNLKKKAPDPEPLPPAELPRELRSRRRRSPSKSGDRKKRARLDVESFKDPPRPYPSPSELPTGVPPLRQDGAQGRSEPKGKSGGKGKSKGRNFQISKALARVLRHTAQNLGIPIRGDGFCKLSDILALPEFVALGCTQDDIQEGPGLPRAAVESNDKKRFEMKTEESKALVRAVQGHSMKTVDDDSLLKRLAADDPDLPKVCVHGTYKRCVESIQRNGLLAGGGVSDRNHVHFAPFEPHDGLMSKFVVRTTHQAVKDAKSRQVLRRQAWHKKMKVARDAFRRDMEKEISNAWQRLHGFKEAQWQRGTDQVAKWKDQLQVAKRATEKQRQEDGETWVQRFAEVQQQAADEAEDFLQNCACSPDQTTLGPIFVARHDERLSERWSKTYQEMMKEFQRSMNSEPKMWKDSFRSAMIRLGKGGQRIQKRWLDLFHSTMQDMGDQEMKEVKDWVAQFKDLRSLTTKDGRSCPALPTTTGSTCHTHSTHEELKNRAKLVDAGRRLRPTDFRCQKSILQTIDKCRAEEMQRLKWQAWNRKNWVKKFRQEQDRLYRRQQERHWDVLNSFAAPGIWDGQTGQVSDGNLHNPESDMFLSWLERRRS